jgi:hypothetical protein
MDVPRRRHIGGGSAGASSRRQTAFTWTANNLDGQPTLVTVEFIEISRTETELILTHEHIPRKEVSDRYQSGWTKIVELLVHERLKPARPYGERHRG